MGMSGKWKAGLLEVAMKGLKPVNWGIDGNQTSSTSPSTHHNTSWDFVGFGDLLLDHRTLSRGRGNLVLTYRPVHAARRIHGLPLHRLNWRQEIQVTPLRNASQLWCPSV